ncbi:MAG: UbiD family decarboxylase, partial [Burkholderiales bacterium]
MLDLRTFLASIPDAVFRPAGELSVRHEITALQHALEAANRHPVIVVDRPRLLDGRVSTIPVVCNLTASRVLTAKALGIADHREAGRVIAERFAHPIAPITVDRRDAPVQAVIIEGDAADLTALPALHQHVMDPGPYLTAAHATTYDPDTGIDNTSIQRCWVKGPREMSFFPYPSSHNHRNMRKFWARGEDCPVVFWIGHHPAVSVGAQAKVKYPQSHWAAAGGLVGEPIRLVPSVTFGDKLMVPADAEVVIEGVVPRDTWAADGPFGEYHGYLGPQTLAPICRITAITRRSNAMWHDYGSGLADMLVPDNMSIEGKLYGHIKSVVATLQSVYVPVSGRRFHVYLQLKDPLPGEARDALTAALSYRRCKAAFAVDADIDVFDDRAMMWALATRVQWDRDQIMIPGLTGSALDPSWPLGAKTAAKIGIDATMPTATDPSAPKPFPPRAVVPDTALARAQALLAGVDA